MCKRCFYYFYVLDAPAMKNQNKNGSESRMPRGNMSIGIMMKDNTP